MVCANFGTLERYEKTQESKIPTSIARENPPTVVIESPVPYDDGTSELTVKRIHVARTCS